MNRACYWHTLQFSNLTVMGQLGSEDNKKQSEYRSRIIMLGTRVILRREPVVRLEEIENKRCC